jgi:replicative DNA helicase
VAFAVGNRVIRRLCVDQNPLAWQHAKLSPVLFKSYEQPVFEWVRDHLKMHHALPKIETLQSQFPDIAQLDTPEPASYYVEMLENQYCYETINDANLKSQQILKDDQNAYPQALEALKGATRAITEQKYRVRILDVAKEAPAMVLTAYHHTQQVEALVEFGWPYMDQQSGGVMPGDVISFVGRPAAGKTWKMLWTAMRNWRKQQNVLFVSMEMMTLPIAQRIASLYTHQNIQQLKTSGFSTQTLQKFYTGLKAMTLEEAKFYVIDGNLAASAEDIFMLADMLECKLVFIDGAYLLRHRNLRLDRYTRAAENVELIKRFNTDLGMSTFCSWQFNRTASQKQKKGHGEHGELEDIGYTDAIGQISSIALGLFQEDSVETMKYRRVRVLKGRNGEVGQFSIAWDFTAMSFVQVDPPPETGKPVEQHELQWV